MISMSIVLTVLVLLVAAYLLWKPRCSSPPTNIMSLHEEKKTKYRGELQKWRPPKQNDRARRLEYHSKLYELHYAGVADIYDRHGTKIQGIEPNAQKAVQHLRKIIHYSPVLQQRGYRLMLAKLYHQGMHKFPPQLKVAKNMYLSLLDGSDTDEVAVEAQESLKRINKDIFEAHMNECGPAPKKFANPPIWKSHRPNVRGHQNPVQVVTTGRPHRGEAAPARRRRAPRITRRVNDPPPGEAAPARRRRAHRTTRRADPQNTHDSQVLSTTINSINKLKKSTKMEKSLPTSLKEVRVFLNKQPRNDKRDDALKSLNCIERNTSPFTFSDMKEVDVLNLVWNRMHSDVHEHNLEAVKENLFEQLAAMQEHGVTVCATGRFTRLVDTLNVIDNEVRIKPSYVIHQEMMNKSSKIRENLLNTYSETERKALEEGTSNTQEQFDQKLKEKIVDNLTDDYVKTNILSQEKFDHQISTWIDDI